MVSVKVKNAKVNCNCTCKCSKSDEITDSNEIVKITNRRVHVSASPAFPIEVNNNKRSDLTLDSGCTAECIVNKDFANNLGLPITPTNVQSATLGDGETPMTIVGEIDIDTSYEGNPSKLW